MTDTHKTVGVRFMLLGLFFFLVGGALALLARVEVTLPGFDVLEPLAFNRSVTYHGSLMVFFGVLPALFGLIHAVLPTDLGVNRPARAGLGGASFWIVLLAGVIMLASFVFGGAAAGWTAYVPLALQSVDLGSTLWAVSLLLLTLGLILSAAQFYSTVRETQSESVWDRPVFAWSVLISAVVMLITGPVLIAALALLIAGRLGGDTVNPSSISAALWQNLFWFFAHPSAFVLFIPGIGIVTEVIERYSGATVPSRRHLVTAMIGFGALGVASWGQHMFASGLLDGWRNVFMVTTLLQVIPAAYVIFAWISALWQGEVEFVTPLLFALGVIGLLLFGGLSGVILSAVPVNLQLHDSYFVLGHLHLALFGGAVAAFLTGVYHWFPIITGKPYDEVLGKLHFLAFMGGVTMTFVPMLAAGLYGMPRRVYDYPPGLEWFQFPITGGAFMMLGGLGLFLYNLYFAYRSEGLEPAVDVG